MAEQEEEYTLVVLAQSSGELVAEVDISKEEFSALLSLGLTTLLREVIKRREHQEGLAERSATSLEN